MAIIFGKDVWLNRKRFLLFIFIFFVYIFSVQSQNEFKKILYQYYITGQMDSFAVVLKDMEKDYAKTKKIDVLLEITTSQYALVGYNIGLKNYKLAEDYLAKADINCDLLFKHNPNWSEAYAIKGALLGLHIGLSNFKALYLGRQCIHSIDHALELDYNDPMGWLEKANMLHYAPSIYGGSKKKAITYYQTAISLFELTKKNKYNWNYLNTFAIMGRCYERIGQYEQAKAVYEKVLRIEPNFGWVKNTLYPELKKKMKK